jgi:hypothetical protein
MKTGRDSNRSGSYLSECCLTEVTVLQGQMFPRCPTCFALTDWEFLEQSRKAQRDAETHIVLAPAK